MKINKLGDETLFIIPARGGSKGIPKKNITKIQGKPLIAYTIDFALKLASPQNVLVSTDSSEIADISLIWGASCPFLRPSELSTDFIGDMPVLKHALESYQKLSGKVFHYVVMLQPTSPLRNILDFELAFKKLVTLKFDSIISISYVPTKYHPLKQFEINGENINPFSPRANEIIARQQLSQSCIRNGVFYIFDSNFVGYSETVYSENTGFYHINNPWFNIDSSEDLNDFESFLKLNPNIN